MRFKSYMCTSIDVIVPSFVNTYMKLDKQIFPILDYKYFHTHQFSHVFLVLKITVSLGQIFWVQTTYVLVEKYLSSIMHSSLKACKMISKLRENFRVRTKKIVFLFLNQIMCCESQKKRLIRTVSMRRFS